jgi:hypothetical protein
MADPIGYRRWAIAEGHLPTDGEGHETACLLNATSDEANVQITLFFSDRDPIGPYRIAVPPRRTRHLRFDDLADPERVPRDTDYSSIIESDVPIVVQHTRLDSGGGALLSTIAYAGD